MKRDGPDIVPIHYGPRIERDPEEVIAALTPLVTPERLARIERTATNRTRRIVPVLDQLSDPHNAAAILRSAEAFGAHEVHVIDERWDTMVSAHVTRSADRWLDVVRHTSVSGCIDALRHAGCEIWVASMEGDATPLDLASTKARVAVVFGNERFGPSEPMRRAADRTFAIPMRGLVESLNVSVAAAITLHAATATREGDLDVRERRTVIAQLMLGSVEHGAAIVDELARRRARDPR